ncbi:hypothetical protein A2U01_0096539, partial [Trifolium medium]|nr:hypothetical protein [Trifolium medium]
MHREPSSLYQYLAATDMYLKSEPAKRNHEVKSDTPSPTPPPTPTTVSAT